MKKILLIALILFTTLAYSQKPKVSAVRYTAVTTTERDNFTVPAGEFWRIYNTTTAQNEYWDGDSWEDITAGGEANTASSQGTGTTIFYQKSSVDLQFNAIKSENNLLTVSLDGTTHDVELTVNQGNISITASQVSDFDTEVSNNTEVLDNTDKDTNVPTALSTGTVTATTYGITSDGGADDLVLVEANTDDAGLLGADKWDEIVASTTAIGGFPSFTNLAYTNVNNNFSTNQTVTGIINATSFTGGAIEITDKFRFRAATSRFDIINKAVDNWLQVGIINSAGSENVFDLGNIGSITANSNMVVGGNVSSNPAPTAGDHLTNKTYVDAQSESLELSSKSYSWGESYINNWRDIVLDDGATYFPNNGGYEIGRLHQAEINTSLHFIPAAVGEGIIYAIGKNRTNDLDVDRAAFATYIGEDRILRTAAFDVARIDYTDGDGAILAEDESTNLIERSETFDHASGYWTLSGTTLTSGFSAPDGSTNAYKLVEDGGNSTHYIKVAANITTAGNDVVASYFIKPNGISKLCWREEAATGKWVSVDLTTQIILAGTGNVDVIFENYTDGFTRVSFIIDASASYRHVLYMLDDNYVDSIGYTYTYTGDGTSGIYIFGAQVEEQSYPTSYIKSDSGSSTTRLADVINGSGDVNTFNSLEGVLYLKANALSIGRSANSDIVISDGTLLNRFSFSFKTTDNTIGLFVVVNNVAVINTSYVVSDITIESDYIIVYKDSDWSLYVDGVEIFTTSAIVYPIGILDDLSFETAGVQNFYGRLQQLKYYKSISDAKLDFPYITNFFPLLLIGFRRRNQYKIAA